MKKILSSLFPAVFVALVLGSMMFSHSCANTTQAPTGGDKDTIPPRITGFSPEHMSRNVPVHGAELTFTFDAERGRACYSGNPCRTGHSSQSH